MMKYRIFFLITLLLWGLSPYNVFAVSLSKNNYYANENILITSTGGPWSVFNTSTGAFVGTGSTQEVGDDISGVINNVNANYSIVETVNDDNCGDLSYSACKASANFVGEFLFSITQRSSGAGSAAAVGGGGGGVAAYRPTVKVITPEKDKIYGNIISINYESSDQNDIEGSTSLGLGTSPVTIYYSKTSDTRDKIQLVTDLPAKGIYKWDTKDLPEGNSYTIVVYAKDKIGEEGGAIVDSIGIDHSVPVFTVKTDPTISRGEDVKITVDSSKDLAELPLVTVTQNEFNTFPVTMSGSGTHFEGVYKVVTGYDGPAEIKISGLDLSGNTGDVIAGGNRFSVGVEPPPKPIVTFPIDKELISSGVTDVKGKARKDTEIQLSVNGIFSFSTKPDENGDFIFTNVKLKESFNRGLNTLSIISKDIAGNISESADISLKFNLSPEVFISSPLPGTVLGTSTVIYVKASDRNNDKLIFDYEISKDKGAHWEKIAEGTSNRELVWDTTLYPDGDYTIRITVSDGFSKKTTTAGEFTVKNLIPSFSFAEEGDVSINKKDYILKGTMSSSPKMNVPSLIKSVEYSLDGGQSYYPVNSDSGRFDSSEVKFSISLSDLKEKKYTILLRGIDDRGIKGRATKNLFVDFGAPKEPVVTSVKNGDVISDLKDEDKGVAGVQFTVKGTSEPESTVIVTSDGVTVTGLADEAGNFSVKGVTLKKHGNDELFFTAEDYAGNKSQPVKLSLVYNNLPQIVFRNPRAGRGLNHLSSIDFEIGDKDGDKIKDVVLSYRAPGEVSFRLLNKDSVPGKFEFDVSGMEERSGYELKVETNDGIGSVTKTIPFFVDNTAPAIFLSQIKKNVFKKDFKFEVEGYATDNLSGIEFVEYSLDGEHWFKALISSGFLGKRASFTVKHPFVLEDGEYNIKFRAVDAAGNQSEVQPVRIIVDTMPPRIGNYEISYNDIPIFAEGDKVSVVVGTSLKIKISAEYDTKKLGVSVGDKKLSVNFVPALGVWEGEIVLDKAGSYSIKVTAEDGFGNSIEGKVLGSIEASPRGVIENISANSQDLVSAVVPGAKISVLVFDEGGQRYVEWPGDVYGFQNPIIAAEDGSYLLFLPSGKYEILVQNSGYTNVRTPEFTVSNPKFITDSFKMKKREGVRGYVEDLLGKFMIL